MTACECGGCSPCQDMFEVRGCANELSVCGVGARGTVCRVRGL
jgi:hypothetical protein